VIDLISKEFKGTLAIDGRTPKPKRVKRISEFQNNSRKKLFVGTMSTTGLGINLHAASNCAIIQLGWKPGQLDQAEDRFHRIGQKWNVNVYYLIAKNTIEEDIMGINNEKRRDIEKIIDGKGSKNEDLLEELIKRLRRKK
jgi:SWI/SNF-related matrix-associated actin-dependent regulator 1 of chromatin subfamily A